MGAASDLINAIETGRQAARQQTADAYTRSRQAIVDPLQDAAMQTRNQGAAQQVAQETVTNQQQNDTYARGVAALKLQQKGQFAGAVAEQLKTAPPGTKPSDIAAAAPDAIKKQVGLDTPDALQQFSTAYDSDPSRLTAHAQMYGNPGRKVKSITRGTNAQGDEGSIIEYENGDPGFHKDYAPDKQFRPYAEVDPDMTAAKIALMRAQADKAERPPAPKAGAQTPEQANAAASDLLSTMEQYKSGLTDLDKNGGLVKTNGNIVANALNVAGATGAGKVVGSVLGDKNTAARQRLDEIAPTILHTYAAALGLKSSQLNTEKEYQRFKAVLSDNNAPLQTRLQAINDLQTHVSNAMAARGGEGSGGASSSAPKVIKYDSQGNRVQ